jgi:von Willebrand factor type A domain
MPRQCLPILVLLAAALSGIGACSSDRAPAGDSGGKAGAAAAGRGGSSSAAGAAGFTSDPGRLAGSGGSAETAGFGDSDGGTSAACAKQTARATRKPVYLAFAFDVSGSMGKGDKPWHDRTLKWDPVTQATQSFFEDAKSEGFFASMTFFPADGDEDDRCIATTYQKPDVEMQPLPSKQFGEALTKIGMEDWRGGTPTLYVVQGVFDQIAESEKAKPGRYALVLVTDGYPQDCDDDSIESVAQLVKLKATDVPTYVIGVTNPPISDAPDVTTNLADIAKAGGTGDAYLIDTGNPAQTAADFKKTIDGIRSAAVACELAIPAAPAGQTFDKKKVSVKYSAGGSATALAYDPECKGASSWHYDEANDPKEIVLCSETCKGLQSDESAELAVDFECEQVILGPL